MEPGNENVLPSGNSVDFGKDQFAVEIDRAFLWPSGGDERSSAHFEGCRIEKGHYGVRRPERLALPECPLRRRNRERQTPMLASKCVATSR
jgi:hypothetical protein